LALMARKRPEGSPSPQTCVRYSERVAARIIDEISTGKSLKDVCAAVDMPDPRSIRRWAVERPDFCERYEKARRWSAYALLDEIADLVDRGQEIVAGAVNPNAAASVLREQVNVKRWMVGKLLPERYGDSSKVEMVGAGGKDLIPPHEQSKDRTQLALALLNIIRGSDDPLPERVLPIPEPPLQIDHEPIVPMSARDFREADRRRRMFEGAEATNTY
jgi:hypothetical protein